MSFLTEFDKEAGRSSHYFNSGFSRPSIIKKSQIRVTRGTRPPVACGAILT